jgi:hypothetical protein
LNVPCKERHVTRKHPKLCACRLYVWKTTECVEFQTRWQYPLAGVETELYPLAGVETEIYPLAGVETE